MKHSLCKSVSKNLFIKCIVTAIISITLIYTSAYIYFSNAYLTDKDKADNILIPARVDIAIVENDSVTGDTQNYNNFENGSDKVVKVKNIKQDNSVNAYVRVAVLPIWKNESTNNSNGIVTGKASVSDNKIIYNNITIVLSDKWKEKWIYCETDGYFYYKDILYVNQTSPELITSVQYTPVSGKYLEVQILADGIQSDGNAYLQWNNITKTSDGTLSLK